MYAHIHVVGIVRDWQGISDNPCLFADMCIVEPYYSHATTISVVSIERLHGATPPEDCYH